MVGLPGWGLHSSLDSWPSRPLGVWPGWKPAPGLAPELSLVWPKGSPRAWLSPRVTELIKMASGGDLSSAVGGATFGESSGVEEYAQGAVELRHQGD